MSDMPKTQKKYNRRPKLRACLVFWDAEKKRFKMTAPKTAGAAKKDFDNGISYDAVFLLTDTLEKRFLADIALYQQTMQNSEIGGTFYSRGRISVDELRALEAAPK